MKHILMACGNGYCTSSCARGRVEKILDENGWAGKYDITQCGMADVPKLAASHDFLITITVMSATLDIPSLNGVPFLTGSKIDEATEGLLKLMAS